MAFSTSYMRIETRAVSFLTICLYPYFLLAKWKLTNQFWYQYHEWACISKLDSGYRASIT